MTQVDKYKKMLDEGWEIEFIAKDFGVTVEAVKRALSRAKKKAEAKSGLD